ncbi:PREDICTED: putative F-box protein At5g38270 [Camelina sativa]|uniref:F-box protein At5g38270 n=1 Tax=Camelina sativa TaxID=90675 RepID=A0ABM1QL44_CAMSA|nr:PREDICTED: putative F-box protein At5g38270 [Camelina sativa]
MEKPKDLMREEKGRKVSKNHDWCKLCPDLLRSILESLSSIDFHRAKIVCSDWYSVWKTCVKRPLSILWLASFISTLLTITSRFLISLGNNPYWDHRFRYLKKKNEYICSRRMAIQKSGESNIWERVESIGDDEMLIFGHGVTIRAPVQDVGYEIKSGSIYFVTDDFLPINYRTSTDSNCRVFHLARRILQWQGPKYISTKTQWVFPGFA